MSKYYSPIDLLSYHWFFLDEDLFLKDIEDGFKKRYPGQYKIKVLNNPRRLGFIFDNPKEELIWRLKYCHE